MKVPRITGIITVVIVTLSLLNFILKSYTYFVLIVNHTHDPAKTSTSTIAQETGDLDHPELVFVPLLTFIASKSSVLFRPWVLLTSGFIESGVFSLTGSIILIFYLGRYIETLWGTHEYIMFVIFITLANNTFLWIFYSIKSLCEAGHYVPPVVKGTMPLVMGLLVSVKQRISNHYIIFLQGKVRIKVTYLPLLLVLISGIGYSIDNDYSVAFSLSMVSLVASWIYLRFWKNGANERHSFLLPLALTKRNRNLQNQHTTNSSRNLDVISTSRTKGDRSAQFEFSTFFPLPISQIVSIIAGLTFKLFVKYKYLDANDFGDFDEEDIEIDTSSVEFTTGLKSRLFDLSPLKGAQKVETIPKDASNALKQIWEWISRASPKASSIKFSMEKRRKMALRELD